MLSVVAQLVFGFQDVKSCFLHLLALQLSVIRAKDKNISLENNLVFSISQISGQVPSLSWNIYNCDFHLPIHIQLKKRLSMFPRDF